MYKINNANVSEKEIKDYFFCFNFKQKLLDNLNYIIIKINFKELINNVK